MRISSSIPFPRLADQLDARPATYRPLESRVSYSTHPVTPVTQGAVCAAGLQRHGGGVWPHGDWEDLHHGGQPLAHGHHPPVHGGSFARRFVVCSTPSGLPFVGRVLKGGQKGVPMCLCIFQGSARFPGDGFEHQLWVAIFCAFDGQYVEGHTGIHDIS